MSQCMLLANCYFHLSQFQEEFGKHIRISDKSCPSHVLCIITAPFIQFLCKENMKLKR